MKLAGLTNDLAKSYILGLRPSIILTVGGLGIAYVLQIVLARFMGAENYGIYIYVLAWINILAMISTMGFDFALLKFIPLYQVQNKLKLFRGLLRHSIIVSLTTSSIIALLIVSGFYFLPLTKNYEFIITFIIAGFTLPFITISRIIQSILRSLKHIVLSLLPSTILTPIITLILAGSLYYGTETPLTSIILMSAYAVVIVFMVIIFGFITVRKVSIYSHKYRKIAYSIKEWKLLANSLLFISVMQLIMTQADIILLGALIDTTQAGIYAAASKISILVSFGLGISNQLLAPMISELYHKNQMNRLQEILSLSAAISAVFALCCFLFLMFFGNFFLSLFGNEFTQGTISLYVLMIGQLTNTLFGSVGLVMTMTKHHKEASIAMGLSTLLNIILNILFIPRFGLEGAAVSTCLTMISWNIALWYFIKTKMKLNSTFLPIIFSK